MRRLVTTLLLWTVTLALLAPVALARTDGGEGLYGETNDKVVTNAGFLVIAFFPLFIAGMSFAQWRLEKRKQARNVAAKGRLTGAEWRGGW